MAQSAFHLSDCARFRPSPPLFFGLLTTWLNFSSLALCSGTAGCPIRRPLFRRHKMLLLFFVLRWFLRQGLWFTVDKVIHHDDVSVPTIIWPRGGVAARDSHPGDACVLKHNAEEGKAPVTLRGQDEAAEQQLVAGAEVLDQGAGLAVSVLDTVSMRLVNIRKDRAKTSDRRSCVAVAGHEEVHVGDVAPNGAEQPRGAERGEDGPVRRVI